MVLAKPAGMNPRQIADGLAAKLLADPRIALAEVAGPGFLNLRLDAGLWQGVVKAALTDPTFGRSTLGQKQKMLVEYVSANPTGPLHVGHTRGAVFGDALASLLDYAGYDVTREYYINDGGAQVDVLARSVYLRYQEAHDLSVDWPEGSYPGDYLIEVGEELKAAIGDKYLESPEDDWLEEIRLFATERMMDMIRADLAQLGVVMDSFYSEKSLYGTGLIEKAIAELDAKGLMMYGQMTAGSWIYIGSQGIVQGTYETYLAAANKDFGGTKYWNSC